MNISGTPALRLAAILALTTGICAAQLAQKKALTLEVAKTLAAAAEKEAASNKLTMVIVIMDDGGNLLYLERMDGTQIGSIKVATQKAASAVAYKRPTKVFADAMQGGGTAILSLPGAMPIEGGLPLVVDGAVIGSIGASGGSSKEDGMVAKAGMEALAKLLGK
jgi:glc operon protein GlcG